MASYTPAISTIGRAAEFQPPLPGFEGCALPRIRGSASCSVHTLETNDQKAGQSGAEEMGWKDWQTVKRDARNYPAWGRELRDHGVDLGFMSPPPAHPSEIAFRHAW